MTNKNIKNTLLDRTTKVLGNTLSIILLILFIQNPTYAYDYNNKQYQDFLKDAQSIKVKALSSQENKQDTAEVQQIKKQQEEKVQANLQDLLGEENYNAEEIKMNNKNNTDKKISNLLIFISFSMPNNLIKEYTQQAKETGGVLVLRGMIDKSIAKTAIKLNDINNKQGVNAIIDPNLFKLYNIKRVPAIVVAEYKGYPCVDCKQTPIYDKITGAVSLEYALEQIMSSRISSTKNMASIYLLKLRNKGGLE